jgi:hypothetical protein
MHSTNTAAGTTTTSNDLLYEVYTPMICVLTVEIAHAAHVYTYTVEFMHSSILWDVYMRSSIQYIVFCRCILLLLRFQDVGASTANRVYLLLHEATAQQF